MLPLPTSRRARKVARTGKLRAVEALESRRLLDASYYALSAGPFLQDWSNTAQITTNNDWSGVPSITGYLGEGLVTTNGVDPRLVTSATLGTVGVLANQTVTDSGTGAGPAEFEITNPVVAIRAGGNKAVPPAPAPSLVLFLDATGRANLRVHFDIRDLDGSVNNSTEQVAVQYRLSPSDPFINLDGGYVQDASRGPSQATLVTPVDVTLPPVADGQAEVQVRIVTTDAAGTDEWLGVDNIQVNSDAAVPEGTFSFDRSSLRIDETASVATLSVVRTGGVSGEVSVPYTITAGSAVAGENYVATDGTLLFNDGGPAELTIPLAVLHNLTLQGDRTLSIALGTPSAGQLGAYPTLQLTIADDESTPIVLNEVEVNPDGGTDNPFEYVEVRGLPNAPLANLYFVDVNGDSGSSLGISSFVHDLSGASLGSNGLLVIKARTGGPTVAQGSAVSLDPFLEEQAYLSNNSITHILVSSPTPIYAGMDFDTDDDGVIDLPAGAIVLDSVGWTDGGANDKVYSSAVLTQSSGTPDAATRFPHDLTPNAKAAWYNGDLAGSTPANPASLVYDPTKNSGNLPASAALTPGGINVGAGTNAAPDSDADLYSTPFNTKIAVAADEGVLANDTDPDGDLLAAVLDDPANGGTVSLAADGSFFFIPTPGFSGDATFTYHATDGVLDGPTQTATIHVIPPNSPPTISIPAESPVSTAHAPVVFHLADGAFLIADSDAGTDPLSVSIAVTHGTLSLSTISGLEFAVGDGTDDASITFSGSLVDLNNALDGLTFKPEATYHGDALLAVSVDDLGHNGSGGPQAGGGTLVIIVANEAPTAVDDTAEVVEDSAVIIDVLANDTDVEGDGLHVVDATTPLHGAVVINADGTLTYAPAANYSGPDSFQYTVSDGSDEGIAATVNVVVTPVNDPPVAAADEASTDEDTPVIINVLANDTDVDNATLTPVGLTTPAHGSVVVNDDGTVTYTPDAHYNGPDSFQYSVSDGTDTSGAVTVSITVVSVNNPPTAVNDAGTTLEDTAITIAVLSNDTDIDGTLDSVEIATQPAHGTVVVNDDGTVTYTPAANFNGVNADSFTYRAIDSDGGKSAPATVTLTITPVNDAPQLQDQLITTDEDVEAVIDPIATATDADGDPLTAEIVSNPAHGTVAIAADGKIRYTPAANYHGADEFTYRVSDGNLVSNTVVVHITVNSVADAPVLSLPAGNQSVAEGSVYQAIVTATDGDAGDTITFSLGADAPAGMTIDPENGRILWPAPDGPKNVTFTVIATDSATPHLSTEGKVTVEVRNVAPTFTAITNGMAQAGKSFAVAGSIIDPGADAQTATVNYGDGSAAVPLTIASNGSFALNHIYGTAGTYTVTINTTDKDGGQGTTHFQVEVTPAPVTVTTGRAVARGRVASGFALTLSDAVVNAKTAKYRLTLAGRDGVFGTKDDKAIALKKPTYKANTISISLKKKYTLTNQPVRLTVTGLIDARGRQIDGDRDGQAGGAYSVLFSRKTLAATRHQG